MWTSLPFLWSYCNQYLAFLSRWPLYGCLHFAIAIADTTSNLFSFHGVIVLFLFRFVCCLFFFFCSSRSKVTKMLTCTLSRNIQLDFLFHFPEENWPYNLWDMNIIWQTILTARSNEARGLGRSHRKQCVNLIHQVANWLHNKLCTPPPQTKKSLK